MKKVTDICLEVRNAYDALNKTQGQEIWNANDYMDGLIGDIGDLHKLVMAYNGKRQYKAKDNKSLNQAIGHELSDIIWSVVVLAKEFDIDLEDAVLSNMSELKSKLEGKG